MNSGNHFLFVYGTLRKSYDHPLHKLLSKNAYFCGEAFFQGILYVVDTFPGVVPADSSERKVTGEIYKLKNPSRLFLKLDRYEGYHPGFPGKSLFVREKKEVQLNNGESVQAWVYIYNHSTEGLSVVESGDYTLYKR